MGVGGGAVAEQLRVRDGAARLRDLGRLEHEQRRALAHDEAVASRVEGPRGVSRVVVVAVRQRPDDVERSERERTQRDLAAARDGRIDPPLAQVTHRLAERDRARRARVRRRQDRPAHVERDPEVGRRRAAEDRQREVRGDLADPLLEVALVLLLRIGDPAERRAQVDADPLRVRPAIDAGRQPRIVEREPAGDEPELAEPVELARGLGRHPGERVEVVDLGRDLRAERARVEAVDALDRRASRHGGRPGTRRGLSRRR